MASERSWYRIDLMVGRMWAKVSAPMAILVIASVGCGRAARAAEEVGAVDFAHEVVPILKTHCIECHGGEEAEGGLSVNSRALLLEAEVATPGAADQSRLIELVSSSDPEEQMPPHDHPRLTRAEIEVLRNWIDQGLAWEPSFTFALPTYEPPLKPRRPVLPAPTDGRQHPIDRILDHYFALHNVPRPGPLGDAQFLRRVYYDLIGLPPSPAKLAEFLADPFAEKRTDVIEQLLDNREAYATHWLTFWNDLLRNAYWGSGYTDGGRQQITGWLYRSLYENLPYDQFVRDLISPTDESAGFIGGIKWRGNVNASQVREIQFAQNVSQVFLGINMKCASCHDSFVDHWTLADTYKLAGIYAEKPLELHRCDQPTGKFASAGWIFPELGDVDAEAPQKERLAQLAALMTHPQNGRLQRTIVNRLWHRLMGRAIVHPVDAMHAEPWSEDLLDYLAVALVDNQYDLKQLLRLIVTSEAYQSEAVVLEAEPPAKQYVFAGPIAKRLTAEQFLDSIRSITESWPAPDEWAFSTGEAGSEGIYLGRGGQLAAVIHVIDPNLPSPDSAEDVGEVIAKYPLLMRAALTRSDALQSSLGRPNREQVVTTRPTPFTTLEAITLSNGPRFAELLARGAEITKARHQQSPEKLVKWLFQAALTREATAREVELGKNMLGEQITRQTTEDLLWSVFMLPEFHLIR